MAGCTALKPAALDLAPTVEDQMFTVGTAITPLVLPGATGGVVPYSYTLTPALPAGLVLDQATQTISGTPTAPAPTTAFLWEVSDRLGTTTAANFTISIGEATARKETAPNVGVILHGNFPNPFSRTTDIVLDLGQGARVAVLVLDLLGRTVKEVPPYWLAAGAGQRIAVDAATIPAGTYLYRVTVDTGSTLHVETGAMLRVH